MRKAFKYITIIACVIFALALNGCGGKDKSLFVEQKDQYEARYKNCLIDLPNSIAKKTESIGVLTNDCDMSKAYSSDSEEGLLFTRMDSYYVHVFRMAREDFKQKNLDDYVYDHSLADISKAEEIGRQTTPSGVKKVIYTAKGEVLPCRDLYADMIGNVAVMTYRNDVWIATIMATEENDVTFNIAKSLRVDDINKEIKACTIDQYTERNVTAGKSPEKTGEWGEITVMNKKVTGEPTKLLANVKAIHDSADSYGLIQKYKENIEESHYKVNENKRWNIAEIEVDYGSVERKKYDPYINVTVLNEKNKYLERTYVLASEDNILYVLYKEPKENYKLKVGEDNHFIIASNQ